ncbi:FAD:protein FMN transferase [Shewanella alkalitolerans]|uniref:FAD:protein FMN transferase n=1 Tax=Shewanella alkalitolerans TaxID=2864209 RepID=UPI001C658976|nr:FAD:protein FMN transferase [Shewanella alkalitolerans]QYJ99438.1 FAD:protein FMN transferase [Shewanella alkalitolerans]
MISTYEGLKLSSLADLDNQLAVISDESDHAFADSQYGHKNLKGLKGEFMAMASRCEFLARPKQAGSKAQGDKDQGDKTQGDKAQADRTGQERITQAFGRAMAEVKRIEAKYNRFSDSSVLTQINRGAGDWQAIGDETLGLLKFAEHCYRLSQGCFDVTAEPVLALWPFGVGESATPPSDSQIEMALECVGFERLIIEEQRLFLPDGMGIDLGGIAKEYAADRAIEVLRRELPEYDLLVNLGGDMIASLGCEQPWHIGIEDPHKLDTPARVVTLKSGALATSGHSRRYLIHEGKRYGHIIDPSTGYPVKGAPLSVSVFAPQCVVAGMLATLAMLQGEGAEDFLSRQGVVHHIIRG